MSSLALSRALAGAALAVVVGAAALSCTDSHAPPAHPASQPSSMPSSQPSSMPSSQPSSMPSSQPAHDHASSVAYWTCPMHPSVKQSTPGKCPICGMDLTPVTTQEIASGVVVVDDLRRQKIGVRTAPVRKAPFASDIRAVGKVVYDETRLFDVTLKASGYVDKLFVERPGQSIAAGAVVLMLQSAELFGAQGELLASKGNPSLVDAAYSRFELWGIAREDVAAIEKSGVAQQALPVRSARGGVVVDKQVVEGARADAGQRVLRLASLDQVWIEADVYEADLARIAVGDGAVVSVPFADGAGGARGKVSFIYPYLTPETRTGRVRVELKNAQLAFKPDMFADVVIEKAAGPPALQVDKSAVIFTGTRRLVFVDVGDGRLKPVEVKLGRASSSAYEIVSGLKEGDVVVTSGNFLIAAESRLKSAQSYWDEPGAGAAAAAADTDGGPGGAR